MPKINFVGAIVVIEMFCNGRRVSDCLKSSHITKEASIQGQSSESRFSASTTRSMPSIAGLAVRLQKTMDSITTSIRLGADLKYTLGPNAHEPLFGCHRNGTKIVISVATSEEESPCLFTNYNGPDGRPRHKALVRPKSIKHEALIWKMYVSAISVNDRILIRTSGCAALSLRP